ncbi:MAG: MFS transporter [Eggerthellaceae bacterium]|nr:MFS transporter [Eggerthellaceae bacterium]
MSSEKLWSFRFVQLLAIEALFYFGAYLTSPVVSGYAVSLGASMALAGFIAGLNASMALLPRPFMGVVADRLGKKSLLIIAAALFLLASLGCVASTTPAALAFFRTLQGFAFTFRSVSVVSLVTLVAPHEHIGKAIGWLGVTQTVSYALGPMLGSELMLRLGYMGSFVSASALFAVVLVIALLFKAPADAAGMGRAGGRGSSGPSRRFRLLDFVYPPGVPVTIVAGLSMVTHGSAGALILLAADERGVAGVSVYFVVYSIASFVARPLMGHATDKYPLRNVLVPVLLIEIVATVFLAFMDSAWWVAAGGLCMGLGQATAYSVLQAEAVRHASPSELGRAANMFHIGPDLGMGLGPALSGAVLQTWGVTAMFLVCGFLVFVGLVVFLASDARKRVREGSGEQ